MSQVRGSRYGPGVDHGQEVANMSQLDEYASKA